MQLFFEPGTEYLLAEDCRLHDLLKFSALSGGPNLLSLSGSERIERHFCRHFACAALASAVLDL